MSCEMAQVYSESLVVARKPYRCCETGRVIEKGERHWKLSGLWDGKWKTYRQCIGAYHFARKLNKPTRIKYGECEYGFGEVGETMRDFDRDDPIRDEWERVCNGEVTCND